MNILAFSAYYYPETAASLYLSENLFEDFAKNGWSVTLLTPTPTRIVSNTVRAEFTKKPIEVKLNNKLRIIRLPLFRENKSTFLRFLRYLIMSIQFTIKSFSIPSDGLFAGSTPPILGFMVGILSKIKKVPFVYSLQDIFPDSMVNAGMTDKKSLIWKLGRFIENVTYRNADKIVVISEDYKKNLLQKNVPEQKIDIIYNWVEENHVVPISRRDNILIKKYGLDPDKFYITYCGNIGFSQNMELLVDVAKSLQNFDQIIFVLIGNGVYKDKLKERILINKLNNMFIFPFQPYEEIAHVFSLGDVGLVISKPYISKNSLPSKTWSIMSAERPVLASFDIDSELCRIINKSNCGFCVDAGKKTDLVERILYCYRNQDLLGKLGKNGRRFVMDNLSRKNGTIRYIHAIESIIKKGQSK